MSALGEVQPGMGISQSLTDLKPLGPHYVPMTCKSLNVFTEAYPPGTGFEMKKLQAEGSRLFTYQLSSGALEDLVATIDATLAGDPEASPPVLPLTPLFPQPFVVVPAL